MSFEPRTLALLDRTREVLTETRSARGRRHRVTIWVVVAGGKPYVASYRGPRGRWYRELLAAPRRSGALIVGRRRIACRAVRVRAARTRRAVSVAYARKYPRSASLAAMRRADVLATTLRLEPV
ncbi:MAG: DUF2255 family protein [Candidatus Limnocylindria bacterium]